MAKIRIYDVQTNRALGEIDKKESHQTLKEAAMQGEDVPHKHEHLGAIIFNSKGELLTHQRGFWDTDNRNLIDKTIGGHPLSGFGNQSSLLKIANREANFPLTFVSKRELTDIIYHHPRLFKKQSFLIELDYQPDFVSGRLSPDGQTWDHLCMQYTFAGVSNANYETSDSNSIRPIEYFQLKGLIKDHPELFTQDLISLVEKYDPFFIDLVSALKNAPKDENDKELVETFSLSGEYLGTADRKESHEEIKSSYLKGEPQKAKNRHIASVIMGDGGEIYVQIRSVDKSDNPGMYDKLVGGHFSQDDSPVIAAYHENIEEMGIPLNISDDLTWKSILREFPEATRYQAICKMLPPVENYKSWRERKDGDSYEEICDQYFLVGYYSPHFEFIQKESTGVYIFQNRDDLKLKMEQAEKAGEKKFTGDLKYIVDNFWDYLVPMEEAIK